MIPNKKMKLYYDSYEKDFGDGFYPSTTKSEPCTTEIDLTFILDKSNHYWIQTNCTNINGLDGDEGYKLLTLLNESIPEKQCKINGMNSFTKVPELGRSPTLTFGSRLAPNSIDVVEGVGIVNSLGEILYPKKCA